MGCVIKSKHFLVNLGDENKTEEAFQMIHNSKFDLPYGQKTQRLHVAVVVTLHAVIVWLLLLATDHGVIKQLLTPTQVLLIPSEEKPASPPKPSKQIVKQTVPKPDLEIARESSVVSLDFSNEKSSESTSNSKPAPKIEASMVCPIQVKPEIPRQALIKNIQGLIKVEAIVIAGSVKEVHFVSGPRIFYDAVRNAMLQYGCTMKNDPVLAVQEFNFHFE